MFLVGMFFFDAMLNVMLPCLSLVEVDSQISVYVDYLQSCVPNVKVDSNTFEDSMKS